METKKKHPCEIIYEIGGSGIIYGNTIGICRITGKQSKGLPFNKWVKKTFTDWDSLYPGEIISNEALFCFDEQSKIIQEKTRRDKPQRFRTYNHIVDNNSEWHCLTKADKPKIVELIKEGAQLVCLTDSGQKHLLFKHKIGMWQLDDIYIMPDLVKFNFIHGIMMNMLSLGFSQKEIISGDYMQYRIQKVGLKNWRDSELKLKEFRGSQFFDFCAWLMYNQK